MIDKKAQDNDRTDFVHQPGERAEQYKNRKWVCIAFSLCFGAVIFLISLIIYQLANRLPADDFGEYMASLVCAGATFTAGVGIGWASRGGYEKFWRRK